MPRVTRPYQPPKRYTPEELRAALIADLEADLAFSETNDPPTEAWQRYQAKIREDLVNLRAGGPDDRL